MAAWLGRRGFWVGLCLVLGLSGAWAQDMVKRPGVWAQEYSDRKADPAITFGRLENGMRYAIRRNATPAGHTSLRLLIGSGSLQERDDQQGLAHFLEHMAFRGSTHVPSGDSGADIAAAGPRSPPTRIPGWTGPYTSSTCRNRTQRRWIPG